MSRVEINGRILCIFCRRGDRPFDREAGVILNVQTPFHSGKIAYVISSTSSLTYPPPSMRQTDFPLALFLLFGDLFPIFGLSITGSVHFSQYWSCRGYFIDFADHFASLVSFDGNLLAFQGLTYSVSTFFYWLALWGWPGKLNVAFSTFRLDVFPFYRHNVG